MMATMASRAQVIALHDAAAAKVEETAALFASLTPAQARVKTETGWTVAATAAHLALATGFAVTVVSRRAGRVPAAQGRGRRATAPVCRPPPPGHPGDRR